LELFPFDDDYLDKLRRGDPATVQHFVSYFEQLLKAKLRARMLPPDTVSDLCQETFYRVFVAIRKERGRADQKSRPMEESHFEIPSPAPNPESQFYEQEKCTMVRRILKEIPTRDRQILRDLFLNEVDKDEVCLKYKVKRDYLRVLVHRAKDRFRVIYKKDKGSRPDGMRGK
jgi:RNA polymerase sigma-70 factor (ECF subfamily)